MTEHSLGYGSDCAVPGLLHQVLNVCSFSFAFL